MSIAATLALRPPVFWKPNGNPCAYRAKLLEVLRQDGPGVDLRGDPPDMQAGVADVSRLRQLSAASATRAAPRGPSRSPAQRPSCEWRRRRCTAAPTTATAAGGGAKPRRYPRPRRHRHPAPRRSHGGGGGGGCTCRPAPRRGGGGTTQPRWEGAATDAGAGLCDRLAQGLLTQALRQALPRLKPRVVGRRCATCIHGGGQTDGRLGRRCTLPAYVAEGVAAAVMSPPTLQQRATYLPLRQVIAAGSPCGFSSRCRRPPFVERQPLPFVGGQPQPFVGGQPLPFVGGQPLLFVGGQPLPFVGSQPKPFVGGELLPFVGENRCHCHVNGRGWPRKDELFAGRQGHTVVVNGREGGTVDIYDYPWREATAVANCEEVICRTSCTSRSTVIIIQSYPFTHAATLLVV